MDGANAVARFTAKPSESESESARARRRRHELLRGRPQNTASCSERSDAAQEQPSEIEGADHPDTVRAVSEATP